jgi:hypothetical protein
MGFGWGVALKKSSPLVAEFVGFVVNHRSNEALYMQILFLPEVINDDGG